MRIIDADKLIKKLETFMELNKLMANFTSCISHIIRIIKDCDTVDTWKSTKDEPPKESEEIWLSIKTKNNRYIVRHAVYVSGNYQVVDMKFDYKIDHYTGWQPFYAPKPFEPKQESEEK